MHVLPLDLLGVPRLRAERTSGVVTRITARLRVTRRALLGLRARQLSVPANPLRVVREERSRLERTKILLLVTPHALVRLELLLVAMTPETRLHRRKERRPALHAHRASVTLHALPLELGLTEVKLVLEEDLLSGRHHRERGPHRVLEDLLIILVTPRAALRRRRRPALMPTFLRLVTAQTRQTLGLPRRTTLERREVRAVREVREQAPRARSAHQRDRHRDERGPLHGESTTNRASACVSNAAYGVRSNVPESSTRTHGFAAHSTLATPVIDESTPRTGVS